MKKYPKVIYFSNYYGESGYTYADYVSECKENNLEEDEIGDEYSNAFSSWVYDMLDIDWDDFTSNVKYDCNNMECAVLGSVGTWRGNFEIIPKHFNNLLSAIYACIKDCDYFSVTLENGYIHVRSSHHDGTNSFEIRQLSERGRNLDWNDVDEWKDYMGKKIEGYLF